MGNEPSVPRPGTSLQVIGAGLSRTGTASFAEAMRILLDGPVYHGGTQATLAPAVEIRSLIQILQQLPARTKSDQRLMRDLLMQRLDGYAACADAPWYGLVPELLDAYPNAMVICTTRSPEAWVKSMESVQNASTAWFLRVVLFPLPGMRYFVDYINVLRRQWVIIYGAPEPATVQHYERHVAYLKRTVPAEQLVFFHVKDGWEPLCKALGKPVPEVAFPHINDSEAIERLAKRKIVEGLTRWGVGIATLGAVIGAWYILP